MTVAPFEAPKRQRPILMRQGETYGIKLAAIHANRDEKTIRRWCKRYGISRQATKHSPVEVSALGLEMLIHGDLQTLELLRSGQDHHPDVMAYRVFLELE
jgi:hypothetical protein